MGPTRLADICWANVQGLGVASLPLTTLGENEGFRNARVPKSRKLTSGQRLGDATHAFFNLQGLNLGSWVVARCTSLCDLMHVVRWQGGARGGLRSGDEHLDASSLQVLIASQRCAAKVVAVRLSRYERPKA